MTRTQTLEENPHHQTKKDPRLSKYGRSQSGKKNTLSLECYATSIQQEIIVQKESTNSPEPTPEEPSKSMNATRPPKECTIPISPPSITTRDEIPLTKDKTDPIALQEVLVQLQYLASELNKHTQSTPLAPFALQLQDTLMKMSTALVHDDTTATNPPQALPLSPPQDTYSDIVTQNMERYGKLYSSHPQKQARREGTSDKQILSPVVIDFLNSDALPPPSNKDIYKEILHNKPNVQLQKLIQMRRGGILVFVKDIHSLNSLLSPWPTGAFNGATIKCRLAQRGNQTTQDNRLTKQLIIKGIQMETTSEEIQQELERQRITTTKVYRIVSRATQQPTTFIRIHLNNPDNSPGLLLEGFYMNYFHFRVERARPPPTSIKQCYKCQEFNHVSTDCKNQVKCLRCAENHHHKECPKEKNDASCANCGGAHSSVSRQCPTYLALTTTKPTRATTSTATTNHLTTPSLPGSQPLTNTIHLQEDLKGICKDEEMVKRVMDSIRKHRDGPTS